jgi:hypothetical protein
MSCLIRRSYITHPRYLFPEEGKGNVAKLRPGPFALDSKCICMCTEYRKNFCDVDCHQNANQRIQEKKGSGSKDNSCSEDENHARQKRREEIADKLAWLDKQIDQLTRGHSTDDLRDSKQVSLEVKPLQSANAMGPNLQRLPYSDQREIGAAGMREIARNGSYASTGVCESENRWSGDLGTWALLPEDDKWFALRTDEFSAAHRTYLSVTTPTALEYPVMVKALDRDLSYSHARIRSAEILGASC